MYKNVPVDQSTHSIGRTISSSSSSLPSHTNPKTPSLPVQITSAFSPTMQRSRIGDSDIPLPVSYSSSSPKETMLSTSSSISKLKNEVDQLDNLVKDLLSEVNRPIPSHDDKTASICSYSYSHQPNQDSISTLTPSKTNDFDSSSNGTQRTKTTREERIRIKRGAGMDIPLTTSSSSVIRKSTSKPTISSSVDEQLIDSLLESVQNTLRKRSQQNSTGWTTTLPVHHGSNNRRAHSSSSAYTDSVHRMDPIRTRFPIKLNRTESPTSSLSSRRAYSRQDSRDGYISTSTTTIPTHCRATSEPPPDGPIELHRMDLVHSPSRTYLDVHPHEYQYYSRSTLPSRGIRQRAYDQSGYDTDTGAMSSRGYPPRYYRASPSPIYPYSHHRSMFRPDGYDTDSGLISSGRLHMTRTIPAASRMAVIPETVVVNNRLVSSSNLNTLPNQLRSNSFVNQQYRGENLMGYETDSGMNTRQYNYDYRHIPVQREYTDQRWTGNETLARPVPQPQRFEEDQQQYRYAQEHVRGSSIPVYTQPTEREKRTPSINIDVSVTKAPLPTPTFPMINQSYNTNVQTRVGNSTSRNQDESSRRSSLSSAAESDIQRTGAYQAHNVSQFWYKEKMSREDAINSLKTKSPGAFLIRDSQGFPGSFGLAVKVETLPPGIQSKPGADPNAELVRHYLIERMPTGHVRLKGCPNEPEFANLSALVHHHTLTSLALPIKLVLPIVDIAENSRSTAASQQQDTKKMTIKDLLETGAACNVVYLNNVDVESLSGQMAVAKALNSTFDQAERLQAVMVNFKVSNAGITLIDTKKKLFSRHHFPKENVTYCGADYETDRFWTYQYRDLAMLPRAKCFGFVSKKINGNRSSPGDNECHVFAEVDPSQPSSAIVNFVSKVMIGSVPV